MLDGPELFQDILESVVGEGQRVAAGQQDIADHRGLADIVEQRSIWALVRWASREPTVLLRVQCRQYIEQTWVTSIRTRSG